ncbi:hypothetical protein [Labedella endophytica]|uniref:Uncharacterized protein n=1 Tax=Labedella endophytica TaxID=1523160 RepID=A0A3S0WUM6_9MICO|nr:hypothetical protein [Labedella endophytica]RUQ96925.1 hypothetical protein ELQ94_16895 [Labedella endophytica]
MDIASMIISVALTAAIVIPLVIAVVFIRQLRDIARSNRGIGSSGARQAEASGSDDAAESDEPTTPDEPDRV